MRVLSLLSHPACFHPSRKRRIYRLAINGEIGAPCGVPLPLSLLTVVRRLFPLPSASSTAISNQDLIRASTAPSLTRRACSSSTRGVGWCQIAAQVGVHYFGVASIQQPVHFAYGVVLAPLRAVRILFFSQIRFKDRFQYDDCCHLCHSIFDGRYSQRPLLAVWFGNFHFFQTQA